MQTKLVKLSQIRVNDANPRSIKEVKFHKLVTSILVLPKMLELRPIVVDNSMTALGGNMRYRALCAIVDLDESELLSRLNSSKDFQAKTQAERDTLVSYWLAWKDNPTAPVINANNLSDAEKREFIIKDNVSFGDWNFDALANEWDAEDLNDWGVGVWTGKDDDETKCDDNSAQKDLSNKIGFEYKIEVDCINESAQEQMYNELTERGYSCRILTL